MGKLEMFHMFIIIQVNIHSFIGTLSVLFKFNTKLVLLPFATSYEKDVVRPPHCLENFQI